MGNKMLIDATHPEETRVVVLRGNRVEEFDFEAAAKKQLRGNIYLAKVTRVEPSLQAAFVNYGGNRHGFLAFNEIHPDYYQLPMAERQALKAEDARARKQAFSDDDNGDHDTDADEAVADAAPAENDGNSSAQAAAREAAYADDSSDDYASPADVTIALEAALPAATYSANLYDESAESAETEASHVEVVGGHDDADEHHNDHSHDEHSEGHVEMVGSEDALEELPERTRRRRRSYKIQEVIKRGQIILVQVVKEERGNKGAALTTYLSLAGRYTVLMPNTGSGGGISRKISSPGDRKRLREIAGELDVPEGMGLIIRTAGAARTKTEIKRDYEYLLRLWENVRDLTLKSTAPALVYEEGDLIKRSIRDLYNREIDEVLVAGDDAYRDAKDFMRMLMPSHAKNVQAYRDPEPLFTRYEVERQLNAMFSPQVTLPSGGYIVLNQTEALVAIDVNSGKATREFSIEDTALKTNLEASEEIARQLRLRDLAGLIVVDFIDMEEKRNNRAVERRMKECLRNDRARIQVGHISHFGLLEMSRQRLRTGMVEGSTSQCPTCQGTGVVRSTESVALSVLRSLEDWLRTNSPANLNAVASMDVSLYILNQKRGYLYDIESRYGVTLTLTASERMHGSNFYIEKVAPPTPAHPISHAVTQSDRNIQPFEEDEDEDESVQDATTETAAEEETSQRSRRKRRRRRGRGDRPEGRELASGEAGENRHRDAHNEEEDHGDDESGDEVTQAGAAEGEGRGGEDDGQPRRRSRRRGRRGGRHQRGAKREGGELQAEGGEAQPYTANGEHPAESAFSAEQPIVERWGYDAPEAKPQAPSHVEPEVTYTAPVSAPVTAPESTGGDVFRPSEQPAAAHTRSNGVHQPEPVAVTVEESRSEGAQPAPAPEAEVTAARTPKRGWWQRRA